MNHDLLIAELSKEAKVTVKSPWAASMQSFGFSFLFFWVLWGVYGLRSDVFIKLTESWFVLNLGLLFISALAAATASCWSAIPNLQANPLTRYFTLIPVILWGGLLSLEFVNTLLNHPELIQPKAMDFFCIQNFMLFLVIPGAYQFFQVSKLAPTEQKWTGALALLSVTSMGNFSLMMLEKNDAIYHQFAWHLLPTLVFSLLGMQLGKKILKW